MASNGCVVIWKPSVLLGTKVVYFLENSKFF